MFDLYKYLKILILRTLEWIQLPSNWHPVLCQAQNAALEAQANTELAERIKNLEQEVARHKEDSGKAQAEVDRLLEILREMENEKNDKDKKINELERWVETCMFIYIYIYCIYSGLCAGISWLLALE